MVNDLTPVKNVLIGALDKLLREGNCIFNREDTDNAITIAKFYQDTFGTPIPVSEERKEKIIEIFNEQFGLSFNPDYDREFGTFYKEITGEKIPIPDWVRDGFFKKLIQKLERKEFDDAIEISRIYQEFVLDPSVPPERVKDKLPLIVNNCILNKRIRDAKKIADIYSIICKEDFPLQEITTKISYKAIALVKGDSPNDVRLIIRDYEENFGKEFPLEMLKSELVRNMVEYTGYKSELARKLLDFYEDYFGEKPPIKQKLGDLCWETRTPH